MAVSGEHQRCPLRRALDAWTREISWDTPGLGFALLRYIRGSWLSAGPILVHVSFVLRDLALCANLEEARVPLRLYVGAHSSMAAQLIFWRRLHHVQEALRLASHVAAHLEAGLTGTEPSAAGMESAAKLIRRIKSFFAAFTAFTTLSVGFTLFTSVPWLHSPATFAKLVLMTFATMCCVSAYYGLLPLMLGVCVARTALYRELGVRMQAHAGGYKTKVQLHAALLQAGRHMEQLVGSIFPHFLLVGLIMPLVSTAEVILSRGQADSFALGSIPILFIVFVALCMAGQWLHDLSGALPTECYFGPWLTELPTARRARLLVMVLAKKPQEIRVQGFGTLDRPTCVTVMRSWFSYLQILLKFSD